MSKNEKRWDDDRDDDDDHDHGSPHGGHDDDTFHFPVFHAPHGLSPAVLSGLELVYYDFADLFLTATHKQVVHYDSNLDATAHDSHNNIFSGSGNPATPWKVVDNSSAHIELGLDVAYRQGDSIHSSFTDATGATHYTVPDGPQVVDPTHNVPSSNAARAAWKVDFSVDSALGGGTQRLDHFDFKLFLDIDPTTGVNFKELHLARDTSAPDHYVWLDTANHIVIGDGAGNPAHPEQLDQNTMNLAFGYWGGASAAANPTNSHYDVLLTAEDHTSHLPLAVNHIVLDVV